MKIKDIFECEEIGNEKVIVSLDSNTFNGLLRANPTASFIIDCLKEETSEETIISKMIEKYGISKDVAERGTRQIILQLETLGILESNN